SAAPALDAMRSLDPAAHPLEALRLGVTALGASDPDGERIDAAALNRQAIRLTAVMPVLVGAWTRIRRGLEPIDDHSGSTAAVLLRGIGGSEPSQHAVNVMDACLLLHADHELNASAFTARVVAATEADMY